MKFKFIFLIMCLMVGCAQKNIVGPQLPAVPKSGIDHDLSFLKNCSQIRAVNPTHWLLTCQRAPHLERTEIYEWTTDTQKLKRLTYQDGQIWDIAPIDSKRFYYSSSYDEFKEQFVSILGGAKIGSDIYFKNTNETDFQRITSLKGLEISFFWHEATQLLYFVHETDAQSRIMTLDPKHNSQVLYTAKNTSIRNPIYKNHTKTLYWLEYDTDGKSLLIKTMSGKNKKVSNLFRSESKIFQMSTSPKVDQLLIGFATGVGVEIWNFNLTDKCWRLAYRISEPVSEFYVMNDKTLFLTIRNALKPDSFFELAEVCHPSPPGLGVTAL